MKINFLVGSSLRFVLLALLAIPVLTACESDEDRLLAEAEQCINRADASNVDACVAKVAGMESEDAYLIRCSAHFIAQSFTETRLIEAFENIKSSSEISGITPTTVTLSYMVFNNAITNHTVAVSKNDCSRSGATSLSRVLQLVEVATGISDAVVNAGGGAVAVGDGPALEAAITNFVANGGSPTTLGSQAIAIRESFCVNNTGFSSSDICRKVNQAYTSGGGDPTNIGNAILALLD